MDVPVLLGLGANLGDPVAQLAAGVRRLAEWVDVDAVSSVYRTEPVGYADQPDFYNLVLAGRTALAADALLARLHGVEAELGRMRTFANAPRMIDIDLLAYGAEVIGRADLVVPHPRLHLRGFVLHPLAEIAPEWRHPIQGHTARELLESATALERVHLAGALDLAAGALAPVRPHG